MLLNRQTLYAFSKTEVVKYICLNNAIIYAYAQLIHRMSAAQKLAFSGTPVLYFSKQANDLLSSSFWIIGELAYACLVFGHAEIASSPAMLH